VTPGQRRGIAAAILAALAYAFTIPVTKVFVAGTSPWLLAGILYLGSGLGLTVLLLASHRSWSVPLSDTPRLLGAIVCGGVIAPVLMLHGLRGVTGSAASLLLVCEGVFTSLLAWVIFREHLDRRIVIGFVSITAGAVLLAAAPGIAGSLPMTAAGLVLAACLFWAMDNNLTRTVSLSDPMQVAAAKGLVAGITNTLLGTLVGAQWPAPRVALLGAIVGFVGYGLSLALFVYALRELGTARTGAYFSTAPFVAALMSVWFLGEPITSALAVAGAFVALGVWLHVTERHVHEHLHEAQEHEHGHEHDEHHRHHDPDEAVPHWHSHRHVHPVVRHGHPHFPDAHHRHEH